MKAQVVIFLFSVIFQLLAPASAAPVNQTLVAREGRYHELYIVTFKQFALKSLHHWGLYLTPPVPDQKPSGKLQEGQKIPDQGDLYHINAKGPEGTTCVTQAAFDHKTLYPLSKSKTFDPTTAYRVGSGSDSTFTPGYVEATTKAVADQWGFNTFTTNCQSWTLSVLRQMEKDGKLTKKQVDDAQSNVPHIGCEYTNKIYLIQLTISRAFGRDCYRSPDQVTSESGSPPREISGSAAHGKVNTSSPIIYFTYWYMKPHCCL